MSKTSVILPGNWPGAFHRTVRDSKGQPVKDEAGNPRLLTFSPGQAVELTAEELEAVRDDVGKALHIASVDAKAKPVPKIDGKATAAFVEQSRKLKEAAAKKAAAAPAHRETTPHKDIETKGK